MSEIPEEMTTREILQEIEARLAEMYSSLEAEQWWNAPHPQFEGATANSLVDDGRAGELLESLRRLGECVYL